MTSNGQLKAFEEKYAKTAERIFHIMRSHEDNLMRIAQIRALSGDEEHEQAKIRRFIQDLEAVLKRLGINPGALSSNDNNS